MALWYKKRIPSLGQRPLPGLKEWITAELFPYWGALQVRNMDELSIYGLSAAVLQVNPSMGLEVLGAAIAFIYASKQ